MRAPLPSAVRAAARLLAEAPGLFMLSSRSAYFPSLVLQCPVGRTGPALSSSVLLRRKELVVDSRGRTWQGEQGKVAFPPGLER